MTGIPRLLMVLAALCPLCLRAQGIADIVRALEGAGCWHCDVEATVEAGGGMDRPGLDMAYCVRLATAPAAPGDTLAPCDYTVEWRQTGRSSGGGRHGYSRGVFTRIQDGGCPVSFSAADNMGLFTPVERGVQTTARWADLLPQYLALELLRLGRDPHYALAPPRPDDCGGRRALLVEARAAGSEDDDEGGRTRSLWVDAVTFMPLRLVTESTVPQVRVTAVYRMPSAGDSISMGQVLAGAGNTGPGSIEGMPLPGFTLPTSTGERYSRRAGEGLRRPTAVVLLAKHRADNGGVVEAVREAAARVPGGLDVIWAVDTNIPDQAEESVPSLLEGEHLLLRGSTLARKCGITALPAIVVAGHEGTVSKVAAPVNQNGAAVVIETAVTPTQK